MALTKKDLALLKKLSEVNGISGHEHDVKKIVEQELKSVVDKSESDRLGSLITIKNGAKSGAKIMLASHLDEVGFVVSRIDEHGFIFFQPVGGWWPQVLLSQRVTITNSRGKDFIGVIGSKPPHIMPLEERQKVAQIKDMYVDLGVSTKKEVEKLGIQIGDAITPYFEFHEMANPKYLLGKAWDNRIGVAVMIKVMQNLKNIKTTNHIYGVATVQEEVGLRGARTAGQKILPDLAIAVDVGIGGDTPGVSPNEADCKLGDGPIVVVYDSASIANLKLKTAIIDLCQKHKIPYQLEAKLGGGTDAGMIQFAGDGVPVITISLPARYIHSHSSIIHADDFENIVKLLTLIATKLDSKTIKGF